MSLNLNYEDLWNDLYLWARGHAPGTASIMEEMDPRLDEDYSEKARQWDEAHSVADSIISPNN